MMQFYYPDIYQATWAEMRRVLRSPLVFAIAAVMRVLRVRIAPTIFQGRDSLRFIEEGELSQCALASLRPLVAECAEMGFTDPLWATMSTMGPIEGFGCHMLHMSESMFVSIAWAKSSAGNIVKEECVFVVTTRLKNSDVRFLSAANSYMRFNPPAEFCTHYMSPRSLPREVVEAHREQLSRFPLDRVVRLDREGMREAVEEINRIIESNFIARGIWVPLNDAEFEKISAAQAACAGDSGEGTSG